MGAAVVARHRAQSAADLAALAGAADLGAGADAACAQAAVLATAMETVLVACTVEGLDVVLTVQASAALRFFGAPSARAVARAGPAEFTGQVSH